MLDTLTRGRTGGRVALARTHPLSLGLESWWLVRPEMRGGGDWRDMTRGTRLTSAYAGTDVWDGGFLKRPGGGGHVATPAPSSATAIWTGTEVASWNVGTGNFTLAFWVCHRTEGADYSILLLKDDAFQTADGFLLYEDIGDHQYYYSMQAGIYAFGPYDLTTDDWHHLCAVREGTGADQLKLYYDGQLNNIGTDIRTISTTAAIGLDMPQTGGVHAFDDLRFYSRALSAADVALLYADSMQGCPLLLERRLFWPLNGLSTQRVTPTPAVVRYTPVAPRVATPARIQSTPVTVRSTPGVASVRGGTAAGGGLGIPAYTGRIPAIKVDQFGYLPCAKKVAVFSDPYVGYNQPGTRHRTPGPLIYVKSYPGGQLVWTTRVKPIPWQSGTVDDQSGDKAWWIDFTGLRIPGRYVLYDPKTRETSFPFTIATTVYDEALKVAMRMFYYQRCGAPKASPYAGNWTDTACHVGPNQDLGECQDIRDPGNLALTKDLYGGHHDAGDYTKYVPYTCHFLRDLLWAYRMNPSGMADNYNIPESGNGIPDILDECKVSLDNLLKHYQSFNGMVLGKTGCDGIQRGSPPSTDTATRYYAQASTATTALTASTFALGAIAFASAGQTAYAATLTTAAENAWSWAIANPSVDFDNTGFTSPNPDPTGWGAAYGRSMSLFIAACYLYERTGTGTYKTYIDANYLTPQPMAWYFWYPFEHWVQLALLSYTQATGATAANVAEIKLRAGIALNNIYNLGAHQAGVDAYRAYMPAWDYTTGSNMTKCQVGNLLLDGIRFNILPSAYHAQLRDAAAGYLHYIHGVNPNGICYLTNMGAYGVSRSVRQTWHQWFSDGTVYDDALTSLYGPPPGYLVGGPNPGYAGSEGSPPSSQPTQKTWKDFNDEFPDNSWEITECALYYQAAYIRLLSYFVE